MQIVQGSEVKAFLKTAKRVYLCGKLENPDLDTHCHTEGLEIGISSYPRYTAELPHLHRWNWEYNYVIRGEVKAFLFAEQKEYHLHEGDLFVITADMPYITKCLPGTEVLFVKNPGGNDKELLPVTKSIRDWQACWENRMEEEENGRQQAEA